MIKVRIGLILVPSACVLLLFAQVSAAEPSSPASFAERCVSALVKRPVQIGAITGEILAPAALREISIGHRTGSRPDIRIAEIRLSSVEESVLNLSLIEIALRGPENSAVLHIPFAQVEAGLSRFALRPTKGLIKSPSGLKMVVSIEGQWTRPFAIWDAGPRVTGKATTSGVSLDHLRSLVPRSALDSFDRWGLDGSGSLEVATAKEPSQGLLVFTFRSPRLDVRVNGRKITLTSLAATLTPVAGRVRLSRLSARALGGSLTVSSRGDKATTPLSIELSQVPLATLRRTMGGREHGPEGTLSFSVSGTVGDNGFTGSGGVTVRDLVVDPSRSQALAQGKQRLNQAEGVITTGGRFLEGRKLGRVAELLRQGLDDYKTIVSELSGPRNLGLVKSPVTVSPQTATLSGLQGTNLNGRLTISWAKSNLQGYFSRIRFGRVELHDVSISGPLAHPQTYAPLGKITVDGRAPRGAELGDTLSEAKRRGPREAAATLLGEVLKSRQKGEGRPIDALQRLTEELLRSTGR